MFFYGVVVEFCDFLLDVLKIFSGLIIFAPFDGFLGGSWVSSISMGK